MGRANQGKTYWKINDDEVRERLKGLEQADRLDLLTKIFPDREDYEKDRPEIERLREKHEMIGMFWCVNDVVAACP